MRWRTRIKFDACAVPDRPPSQVARLPWATSLDKHATPSHSEFVFAAVRLSLGRSIRRRRALWVASCWDFRI